MVLGWDCLLASLCYNSPRHLASDLAVWQGVSSCINVYAFALSSELGKWSVNELKYTTWFTLKLDDQISSTLVAETAPNHKNSVF